MSDDAPAPKPHAPKGPIKQRVKDLTPNRMDVSYPSKKRCTATSKGSGQQCRRYPIPGGHVCKMHGGGAPQVKQKALERLMALQDPAITRLAELIAQQEFPSTAMAAVKDALDRTLGKPIDTVNLEHSGGMTIKHELPE